LSAQRCNRVRCKLGRRHRCGDENGARVGTARPPDRQRRDRVDGEEEARGLLLMHSLPRPAAEPPAKDLLRFLTCGSVDDGKSTLIGRLLHDSKLIFEDQLAALTKDSVRHGTTGDEIDLALLVDGLE